MISLPPAASGVTSDGTSGATSGGTSGATSGATSGPTSGPTTNAAAHHPAAGHAGATRSRRLPGTSRPDARSGLRPLAAGAIVVLLAFVTVQAGGCGFKTPLQMPKKAVPAKPAS